MDRAKRIFKAIENGIIKFEEALGRLERHRQRKIAEATAQDQATRVELRRRRQARKEWRRIIKSGWR